MSWEMRDDIRDEMRDETRDGRWDEKVDEEWLMAQVAILKDFTFPPTRGVFNSKCLSIMTNRWNNDMILKKTSFVHAECSNTAKKCKNTHENNEK